MKMKNIKMKLFVVMATTLIGGFSLVGCKKETPSAPTVTLDGFTNAEVTAMLGENYELPTTVKDTDGNEYQAVYKVWNESGKEMPISDNAFFVENMEDYVIGCYVRVGADDIRSRFITVKVQDAGAPVITFQDVKKGFVGESYSLPKVAVTDGSGEVLSATVKLYAMNGAKKGEELTTQDGRFVPTVSGNYLVEATATDSSGNTVTATESFYVRDAVRENEILSFDDETDIENIGSTGMDISYLGTFSGENGVAKFTYTGGYLANQFSFLPICDASNFGDLQSNYDTFVVRMYIVQSDDVKNAFTNLAIKDYKTNTNYYSITPVEYNKWVDYKFEIESLQCFAGSALNLRDRAKIWGYGNEDLKDVDTEYKGEFYVADMSAKNQANLSVSGETVLGSTLTIASNGATTGSEIIVTAPSGTQTALEDGTYTISERGAHTVELRGVDVWALTEFNGVPYSFTEKQVEWNGYTLTTYGASNITADGAVVLGAGSYTGATYTSMGVADVPYVAFNGQFASDQSVVVDFTGGNMPNIALFANQPDAETKNFVGASGIMFSQGILNPNGQNEMPNSYKNRINIYGPRLFTKWNSTTYEDDTTNVANGNNVLVYTDASISTGTMIGYDEMQNDVYASYRLLVKFYMNTNKKLQMTAVLLKKNTTGDYPYTIVHIANKILSRTFENLGLSSGSIIVYGRPYAETELDKIHPIYDSENDGEKLLEWTGINPWAEETSTTSAPMQFAVLPKSKEDI